MLQVEAALWKLVYVLCVGILVQRSFVDYGEKMNEENWILMADEKLQP